MSQKRVKAIRRKVLKGAREGQAIKDSVQARAIYALLKGKRAVYRQVPKE
jgi:hypothetical protein